MTRLGFVGLGWIGRNRLRSLVHAGIEPVVYLEPDRTNLAAAHDIHGAADADDLDSVLDHRLDGVVIATPNAMHAQQSRAVVEHGLPVFCQKPLASRKHEAEQVLSAAEHADVLLDVDWSYRGTTALQSVRHAVRSGAIGRCYRAELVFHNAYGPDKAWYRDARLAQGGCLLDLGCHLVDALQWTLPGTYRVAAAHAYGAGQRVRPPAIEDHAMAELVSEEASAHIACSWNVPSGGDADIRFTFYGTQGVVRMRNVSGSFYDFVGESLHGNEARRLAEPPDAWDGRQAVAWARRLPSDRRFDPAAWMIRDNATVLEEIYRCAS